MAWADMSEEEIKDKVEKILNEVSEKCEYMEVPKMKVKTDCHGEVDVLDSAWFNIMNYQGIYGDNLLPKCIGIVKMKDGFGKIKQYIGLGFGIDEKEDTILVLDAGVPFYGSIESGFEA